MRPKVPLEAAAAYLTMRELATDANPAMPRLHQMARNAHLVTVRYADFQDACWGNPDAYPDEVLEAWRRLKDDLLTSPQDIEESREAFFQHQVKAAETYRWRPQLPFDAMFLAFTDPDYAPEVLEPELGFLISPTDVVLFFLCERREPGAPFTHAGYEVLVSQGITVAVDKPHSFFGMRGIGALLGCEYDLQTVPRNRYPALLNRLRGKPGKPQTSKLPPGCHELTVSNWRPPLGDMAASASGGHVATYLLTGRLPMAPATAKYLAKDERRVIVNGMDPVSDDIQRIFDARGITQRPGHWISVLTVVRRPRRARPFIDERALP